MFFLLSLMGTASLFVLLDAFLLAVLLVLVYASAVVALFLFIIICSTCTAGSQAVQADHDGGQRLCRDPARPRRAGLRAAGAAASAPVGAEVVAVGATLKGYAAQLFTTYLLPVQIVGFFCSSPCSASLC